MLTANKGNKSVNVVLRVDMVVDGERMEKGDVVEISGHNFKYLVQHDRVAEATTENIAAVKAEVKSAKEAAERAKLPSDNEVLKARVANLEAELATAKKGK
jgi:ribosomal protein L9